MTARLLCKFGEMEGAEFSIDANATIGRGQDNTIVLASGSISTEHARIVWDEAAENYVIEDLDSLNGTKLDGIALRGKQALRTLHVMNFGRALEFIFVAESAQPAPKAPAEPTEAKAGTKTKIDLEPLALPQELVEADDSPAPENSDEDEREVTAVGYEIVDLPPVLSRQTESEGEDASGTAQESDSDPAGSPADER